MELFIQDSFVILRRGLIREKKEMTSCPRCVKEDCVKDGIVRGRQRWRCRECGYRHTVQQRGKDAHLKRQAVELYLEGLGFRSIGRFLKVSHVAVYNWIRGFGEKLEELRSANEIEVVEMDEMHTYIGSKKLLLDLDCC